MYVPGALSTMRRAQGASTPPCRAWSRSMQTIRSWLVRTNPIPAPAFEPTAARYVDQVSGFVDEAGTTLLALMDSGTLRAVWRTHWLRLLRPSGTGSAIRCRLRQAAVRQLPEQKRALWACLAPRCSRQRSQRRVFMGASLAQMCNGNTGFDLRE